MPEFRFPNPYEIVRSEWKNVEEDGNLLYEESTIGVIGAENPILILQVFPPDEKGWCKGLIQVFVNDVKRSIVTKVIGSPNPNQKTVLGDSFFIKDVILRAAGSWFALVGYSFAWRVI